MCGGWIMTEFKWLRKRRRLKCIRIYEIQYFAESVSFLVGQGPGFRRWKNEEL